MDPLIEWWGYSPEHGWVVLDRTIPENRPSRPDRLLFVRCSDWSVFEEEKARWKSPHYVFAPNFISALARQEADTTTTLLETLRKTYEAKRTALFQRHLSEKHAAHMARIGKPDRGVRARVHLGKGRRVTHCYNCKQHLDNAIDLECVACGWIICGDCGACGCGYSSMP